MGMIPAPPADSSLRYAAELLSVIIGDYTGSRMYWEIVDPGFADSADFGYAEYDGSGAYLYYISCAPEDVDVNLSRLDEILQEVMTGGVTANEIEQARNKVASRIVLASERPMGRLGSLGGNWVYRNEYRSVEADLETIKNLTASDLQKLLKAYPLSQTTIVGIGPREELV